MVFIIKIKCTYEILLSSLCNWCTQIRLPTVAKTLWFSNYPDKHCSNLISTWTAMTDWAVDGFTNIWLSWQISIWITTDFELLRFQYVTKESRNCDIVREKIILCGLCIFNFSVVSENSYRSILVEHRVSGSSLTACRFLWNSGMLAYSCLIYIHLLTYI